jgi:hypothetical protein
MERNFEVGKVDRFPKTKKASNNEDTFQLCKDTFCRPFEVLTTNQETPNPAKICSKTFINESNGSDRLSVVITESVKEVITFESRTQVFETFVGHEDSKQDESNKANNTYDRSQNVSLDLSISLPDVELTMSPVQKAVPESAKVFIEVRPY